MRILMVNNEFPPLGGGTASVNLALFREFAGVEDLEIDLVTSSSGDAVQQEQFSDRITIYRESVGSRNPHHASNVELIRYALAAQRVGRRLHAERPYDLAMAWHAVPAGWAALQLHRRCGLKYIVRVGGADIPGFERRYRFLYPFLLPVLKSVWRHAARMVVKCQWEADGIKGICPDAAVTTIPNGVDCDLFLPADAMPVGGPLRLVCTGRLIQRKGQRMLISAVKRLQGKGVDVSLDLVGTGDDQTVLQRQARELGVAARVHFAGYVDRKQIAGHYHSAHVFVLNSYNEGMSISTLEAMACGLPVVVTPAGGTDRLVREGENGFFFDFDDESALVEHLRHLDGNRGLLRTMGETSRRIAEEFSWQAAAAQYLKLFREVA